MLIGYVPNMNVERNSLRCSIWVMEAELVHATPRSFKLKFVTRFSLQCVYSVSTWRCYLYLQKQKVNIEHHIKCITQIYTLLPTHYTEHIEKLYAGTFFPPRPSRISLLDSSEITIVCNRTKNLHLTKTQPH